jgi:dihydrofolate reductase
MKAIAAMSLNRVIGCAGKIPWHLPEDFQWFKRMTIGQVVLMGRKTFDSMGKPLPNRTNLVLSRGESIPGVTMIKSLEELSPSRYSPQEIFVIGGAEVYAQLLPRCTELYLSLVFQDVIGETFFPPFENSFELIDVPLRHEKFEVRHYRNLDI